MTFLSGWRRRKSKTISGSTAGAQTNYQLQLNVFKSSGTDTNTNIYLGLNVRDDFGDIRFTTSDGTTLLDYWIESIISGTSAIIWVEINLIPASPDSTSIFIYYNNPTATDLSNGQNTFIVFSDSTDVGSWNGNSTNFGGELRFQGTNFTCNRKIINLPKPFVVESRFKGVNPTNSLNFFVMEGTDTNVTNGNRNSQTFHEDVTMAGWGYQEYIGGSTTLVSPFNMGTYYILKESIIGLNNYNHQLFDSDRNSLGLVTGKLHSFGTDLDPVQSIAFGCGNSASFTRDIRVTWLFIRKYANPEPIYESTGSETTPSITQISKLKQKGVSSPGATLLGKTKTIR